MVLKNCEPESSLVKLFNMHLKESSFPDCYKISCIVPVFENVRERSKTKNHHFVSLLSVVCKMFEKLANNKLVYHLKKYDLFSYFLYCFRSS